MRRLIILGLYKIILPILFLLALPAWVMKMRKRGGFGTGLKQRLGLYDETEDEEPKGVIYVHAVSVGENMIALKLINAWHLEHPDQRFVLAVTTATGHEVARKQASEWLRVIYSPVDFGFLVNFILDRFKPKALVLIDSEIWPNLLNKCRKKGVPVFVANGRLSPRSGGRYRKVKWLISPIFAMVRTIFVQEESDLERWKAIGMNPESLCLTGSIKYDFDGGVKPTKREEFTEILSRYSGGRKVVMIMSSFPGEEKLVAESLKDLWPEIFMVFVPRHMERRGEVCADLEGLGLFPVLRSDLVSREGAETCLIVDSTGELRDWTAHAEVAIIGKSWLEVGGQNPTEAIAARVPVIVGPRMDNFQPLVESLLAKRGVAQLKNEKELREAVESLLSNDSKLSVFLDNAESVLIEHCGATKRTISFITKEC